MLEQLTQLVQQYGNASVVENTNIPNEQNEAVLQETGNSIFSSLQKMATEGDFSQIASILQSNDFTENNPAVQQISENASSAISEKFGLSQNISSGAMASMIPKILENLVGNANNPKDTSFNISDILNSLTGGNTAQNNGIMEAISTYGIHFGLDQNADGKVDLTDVAELSKKGGLSGIFSKLFGK